MAASRDGERSRSVVGDRPAKANDSNKACCTLRGILKGGLDFGLGLAFGCGGMIVAPTGAG